MRMTFFKTEERRVPLKYRNTPEIGNETKKTTDKQVTALPVLLYGKNKNNEKAELTEVINVLPNSSLSGKNGG